MLYITLTGKDEEGLATGTEEEGLAPSSAIPNKCNRKDGVRQSSVLEQHRKDKKRGIFRRSYRYSVSLLYMQWVFPGPYIPGCHVGCPEGIPTIPGPGTSHTRYYDLLYLE